MSSTAAPYGLNPVRHVNGKFLPPPRAITGGIASGYSANIFYGSPVMLNTNGTLTIATTNADIIGVFAGCQFIPSATGLLTPQPNWVASATYIAGSMTAYVWDDPGIIYEIQSNGSLAATALGDQADFVNPGNGNSTLGTSTAAISSTLSGAGVQAQLRIVGVSNKIDNAWGDSFTQVEVMIARHQYVSNKVAV
jgi:hypothetical protein